MRHDEGLTLKTSAIHIHYKLVIKYSSKVFTCLRREFELSNSFIFRYKSNSFPALLYRQWILAFINKYSNIFTRVKNKQHYSYPR